MAMAGAGLQLATKFPHTQKFFFFWERTWEYCVHYQGLSQWQQQLKIYSREKVSEGKFYTTEYFLGDKKDKVIEVENFLDDKHK